MNEEPNATMNEAPSMANSPASSPGTGASLPLSAQNAEMHSILEAAVGLSSLAGSSNKMMYGERAALNESTQSDGATPVKLAPASQGMYPKHTLPSMVVDQLNSTLPSSFPRPLARYFGNATSTTSTADPPRAASSSRFGPTPAGYGPLQPGMESLFNHWPPVRTISSNADTSSFDHTSATTPFYQPTPLPTPQQLPFPAHTKTFPEILYNLVSNKAYDHIVSWLPHGRGFVINDESLFESLILPVHFKTPKYTSFTRRLKRWRFRRVPRGPERGAYYNIEFVRDRPDLVEKMTYHPIKEQESGADDQEAKSASKTNELSLKVKIEREVDRKVQEILLKQEADAKTSKLPAKKRKQWRDFELGPNILGQNSAKVVSSSDTPSRAADPPLHNSLPPTKRIRAASAADVPLAQCPQGSKLPRVASYHGFGSFGPGDLNNERLNNERRLVEFERKLFVARSRMSRFDSATASSSISSISDHSIAKPYSGTGSLASSLSMGNGSLQRFLPQDPPQDSKISATILQLEKTKRLLEAERDAQLQRHRPMQRRNSIIIRKGSAPNLGMIPLSSAERASSGIFPRSTTLPSNDLSMHNNSLSGRTSKSDSGGNEQWTNK